MHPKGAGSAAVSGLVGSGWAAAVLLRMHEPVEKTVLSLCTVGKLFFQVERVVVGREPCYHKLVNGRCGLSHETCRGWLQEHLCEVWGLKTGQNWGHGMLNSCIG